MLLADFHSVEHDINAYFSDGTIKYFHLKQVFHFIKNLFQTDKILL